MTPPINNAQKHPDEVKSIADLMSFTCDAASFLTLKRLGGVDQDFGDASTPLRQQVSAALSSIGIQVPFGLLEPTYRGHAFSDWPLVPDFFRESPNPKRPFPPSWEHHFLDDFREHAVSRMDNPPPHDDRIAWLTLARHHGVPTRILDWTFSPLIALFFAVDEALHHEQADGRIWAGMLTTPEANPDSEEDVANTLVNDAFKFSSPSSSRYDSLRARHVTQRVRAQSCSFTIHDDSTPLEARSESPNTLYYATVPAESKRALRCEFAMLGISRRDLFPDLSTLGDFVARLSYASHPSDEPAGDDASSAL